MMNRKAGRDRAGEILLREGLVNAEALERATREAPDLGLRVGGALARLSLLEESVLVRTLAGVWQVQAVDLDRIEVEPRVARLITPDLAMRHLVLPLRRVGRRLTVAMVDPLDLTAIDDLKFATGLEIDPVLVGEITLRRHLERYYDVVEERVQSLLSDILEEQDMELLAETEVEDEVSVAALREQVDAVPVVRFINGILTDAVSRGASDIHIEPYEKELRVRYRIDGVLQEVMKPPLKMKAALTSRIKILADLNIAERRIPQDGRIKMRFRDKVVDFRVSTLPVIFGEKIVLRILDQGGLTLDLTKFGFEPQAEKDFMHAIDQPYGMVLVTGPTGSGKTTTLYSALSQINTDGVNILTAEDPVEYNIHGINQVLVRTEIGMSFANALRAFLRQDPNIIMVGEIRDLETGGISIKAALTGHLVLSTLHTNDAPSTITRLIDMGLEPFNVASALSLVTAQRLVRRICSECSEVVTYPKDYLEAARIPEDFAQRATFRRGRGCERCNGSGYRGRQGLYEVMAITANIRRLIMAEASTDDLREAAIAEGMLTLRTDGLKKVERGVTTLEEVIKETAVVT
jgi:type IV pilus assembly protein PilB